MSTKSQLFHAHKFCNPNNSITEPLTHTAFHKPPKHRHSSVHYTIAVKQGQPESTTVSSQNTTQHSQSNGSHTVTFMLSTATNGLTRSVRNYQECQCHASMLQNGSQEDVHIQCIVLHTTSSSS